MTSHLITFLIAIIAAGVTVFLALRSHIQALKEQVNSKKIDAYQEAISYFLTVNNEMARRKLELGDSDEFKNYLEKRRSELESIRISIIAYGSDEVLHQFVNTHRSMKDRSIPPEHSGNPLYWAERYLVEIGKLAHCIRKELIKTKISDTEMYEDILGLKNDRHYSKNPSK